MDAKYQEIRNSKNKMMGKLYFSDATLAVEVKVGHSFMRIVLPPDTLLRFEFDDDSPAP